MNLVPQPQQEHLVSIFSCGLRNQRFTKFSLVSRLQMACNQCYPTNFENSNTKYKTKGIFSNSINEIIWALHVSTRHAHQFGDIFEVYFYS